MKKIGLFFFLLILCIPRHAAAVIITVQSVSVFGQGVDTVTTGNITTTSGNLLICDAAYYTTGTFTNIQDSKSNTYSTAVAELTSTTNYHLQQRYKENATGGSSHNFTINFSAGSGSYPAIACKEIAGALTSGALDKTSSSALESGSPMSSGTTASTAQANELLAGSGTIVVNSSTFTAQSGFTADQNISAISGVNIGIISASKVVSATGTTEFTCDAPGNTGDGMALIATYKAAAAAAANITRRVINQ